MDDAELVRAFQAGDDEAFAELFERYRQSVMRTAYLIVGNRQDSENVLQDSFIKVWHSLSGLREPEGFRSWLWRIVVRTAWENCRRREREQPVADVAEAADAANAANAVGEDFSVEQTLRREETSEIWAAVNRLNLKQRTVVILYYYNGMSIREIAAVTGSLSGTVKSRLFAARERLRRELTKTISGCAKEVECDAGGQKI